MSILEKDFEQILVEKLDWDVLSDCTVLVTGATGMIGSYLVKLLDYANRKKHLEVKILAAARTWDKANHVLQGCHCKVICGDLCLPLTVEENVDYVFHCACITESRRMVSHPAETAGIIIKGTENILNLAKEKHVKSMVYFSSMEVYGQPATVEWIREEDLGYIPLFNARSSYPMAKRMAEHLCFDYSKEYGVPVKIARLAQTFGPGILPGEKRIFAQLAMCVIEEKDIVLHTTGESSGNYCYLADCIRGVFRLLLNGKDGEAYNIVNEACCTTIRDMAEMVATDIARDRIRVLICQSKDAGRIYPETVKLRLSSEKLKKLGWEPHISLKEMYLRMIVYMNEIYTSVK